MRASWTEWVSGFWQWTCLPIFMAMMLTAACRWSGVATTTASMSFWLSSILRKSACSLALGNCLASRARTF